MKALKANNLLDIRWVMPVSGGIVIALATAFILRMSIVWAGLITVGLIIFVSSLAVRDFKSYWLGVFAFSLPLQIAKVLGDSDHISEIVSLNGIPIGELPVPVIYLSDLPFTVLMICWIFEIAYKKQKVFFPGSNLMALFFIGWAGLSLIKAPLLSYALFDFIKIVKLYFVYLYLANNILSESRLKILINCFLIGVAIQGLICLFQYVSQDVSHIFGNLFGQKDFYSKESFNKYSKFVFSAYSSGNYVKRAGGTVGPINAEAQYFEFLLPMAFILWLSAKRFWSRYFNLIIFTLGCLGLIVTFSRGGLIGLISGITAVFVIGKLYKLISNRQFFTIIFVCLITGLLMLPKFYDYNMSRPEGITARIHLNKVAINIIMDMPIMGTGLNNHLIVASKYDPETYVLPMPTHNHYLLVATEIGIPGLVFFLGFLITTCRTALKASRSANIYIAAVSLGILGAYAALSVHLLVDWLATYTNQTFLWLYAGLTAALSRLDVMEPESSDGIAVNANRSLAGEFYNG
jgi:O-antigen ligase